MRLSVLKGRLCFDFNDSDDIKSIGDPMPWHMKLSIYMTIPPLPPQLEPSFDRKFHLSRLNLLVLPPDYTPCLNAFSILRPRILSHSIERLPAILCVSAFSVAVVGTLTIPSLRLLYQINELVFHVRP